MAAYYLAGAKTKHLADDFDFSILMADDVDGYDYIDDFVIAFMTIEIVVDEMSAYVCGPILMMPTVLHVRNPIEIMTIPNESK